MYNSTHSPPILKSAVELSFYGVPLTPMQTSEIGGGWLVHHRQRSFSLRTRRLAWLYPVYQGNNIVYKDSQYFRDGVR